MDVRIDEGPTAAEVARALFEDLARRTGNRILMTFAA
jgi:hypothetical protein